MDYRIKNLQQFGETNSEMSSASVGQDSTHWRCPLTFLFAGCMFSDTWNDICLQDCNMHSATLEKTVHQRVL